VPNEADDGETSIDEGTLAKLNVDKPFHSLEKYYNYLPKTDEDQYGMAVCRICTAHHSKRSHIRARHLKTQHPPCFKAYTAANLEKHKENRKKFEAKKCRAEKKLTRNVPIEVKLPTEFFGNFCGFNFDDKYLRIRH
jgi:hypothetical protein